MKINKLLVVIILIAGLAIVYLLKQQALTSLTPKNSSPEQVSTATSEYAVSIIPTDFSTEINNKYFRLPVGRELVFEAVTQEGKKEKITITIPGETREIMGVNTLVYRDIVTIDGELVEDTKDYLAQDKNGNVWYFGEEVNNYEEGKLVDHDGTWIAGENGAQPGIWIKSEHVVGDVYLQEYYKGIAEDTREVKAVGEAVEIKKGKYQDCVKMYDFTPLDPKSLEYKYYCSETGSLVLSEHLTKNERVELVKAN